MSAFERPQYVELVVDDTTPADLDVHLDAATHAFGAPARENRRR